MLQKVQNKAPKKSLGQNFLINENAAKRIVGSLGLSSSDTVLEIGAGGGALTKYLLGECRGVIAVEIDKRWCRYLQDKFSDFDNFHVVNRDILKFDLKEHIKGKKIKIVGNIPYHLTAPIISFLTDNRNLISLCLLTVQREVANRVCAKPRTKDWSLLSILVQLYCDAETLFVLKPNSFYPPPKVHSAVVKLMFLDDLGVKVKDVGQFFKVAKMMFQQKRKMIINSLTSGLNLSKEELKKKLEEVNIDYSLRPQALSLEELATISSTLR